MSSESGQNNQPIFFPLDQGERASHMAVNQLLPRAVYENLAQMVKESLPEPEQADAGDTSMRLARDRGHMTIFLDGDRGTGKTTVIVNLPQYLQADGVRERYEGLAEAVHVLQPIDPSQLEDGDDLFLNVVVAAVLGDEQIKAQRNEKPDQWQALHNSLQELGSALKGKETQSEGVGLDRLRAFMGTQALVGAVHDFFLKAALLLGKRLLVLPIDDVDTTLHRAFENLEVVRRYLVSPVLLPIVCGDLSLYQEVTWRDTFRRLTVDVVHYHEQAKPLAENLAHEYLRKILPLHRRLRMPQVGEFLGNYKVFLGSEHRIGDTPRLPLPELDSWLRALLQGAVNNNENSRLRIPILTVRGLSQLLSRVRTNIPALEKAFFEEAAPLPETELMRRISFVRHGRSISRRHDEQAEPAVAQTPSETVSLAKWQSALLNHFMFEPTAGGVCLVLLAGQHWNEASEGSVLDTPLFQPLQQIARPELRYIATRAALNWKMDLDGRLPESWVSTLKDEAILPFATPEAGRAIKTVQWELPGEKDDPQSSASMRVLIDLITHRNFYSTSKRTTLICSGRVLELIVTSLVRNVSSGDVIRILADAPFHSAVRVAATKAVQFSLNEMESPDFEPDEEPASSARPGSGDPGTRARNTAVEKLASDINEWRRSVQAERLPRSPWLIYCALNKALNQSPIFTRPLSVNEQPKAELLSDVAASGLSAFNAFWAALASFEKGPLFDLGSEISNVNLLQRRGDFTRNDLYTQNIRPLVEMGEAKTPGLQRISATWALDKHPLRLRLQELFESVKAQEDVPPKTADFDDARKYLLHALRLPLNTRRVTVQLIKKALLRTVPSGGNAKQSGEYLLDNMQKLFPKSNQLSTLRRAIEELGENKSNTGKS